MNSQKSTTMLLVVLERKNRGTLLKKLQHKTAQQNASTIVQLLKKLPQSLRQSITYDKGSKHTDHETVNQQLNTRSFFCTSYHRWAKGAVAHAAGMVRRVFPKKTDFVKVSESDIAIAEFLLNTRPKKCLNYLTLCGVLNQRCVVFTL